MVFETAMGSGEGGGFQEITEALSRLKERVLEREVYREETTGLLLLVVKVEPEQEDKTIQELLEIGLPKDIIFYYYSKRIKSKGGRSAARPSTQTNKRGKQSLRQFCCAVLHQTEMIKERFGRGRHYENEEGG